MIHVRRTLDTYDVNSHIREQIRYFEINQIEFLPFDYPLEKIVFLNIETTGVDYQFSRITIASIFYYSDGQWVVEQWFTENKEDEINTIYEVYNAFLYFEYIITYNGSSFILPFIIDKFAKHHLDPSIITDSSLDLYPLMKKFKKKYEFTNINLKTIESFLGINRNFIIQGVEIASYYNLATDGSDQHRNVLLDYNAEDVIYLAPVLIYFSQDFFSIINKSTK